MEEYYEYKENTLWNWYSHEKPILAARLAALTKNPKYRKWRQIEQTIGLEERVPSRHF